jgi:hypothetical protein
MAETEDRLRNGLLCGFFLHAVTGILDWSISCVDFEAFSALIPRGQELNPRCKE